MKSSLVITLSILLFTLYSYAQDQVLSKLPIDSVTNKLMFSEVVKLDSTKKIELYSRAREWFVKTYNSADDVLQMDDKESGKLLGKAFNDITFESIMGSMFTTRMFYTVKIYIKDGRYKYEITDIYYKSYASAQVPSMTTYPDDWFIPEEKVFKSNGKEKVINKGYRNATLESINNLILNLKNSMNIQEKENNSW